MPTYVNVSGTWQELTGTDRPFAKVGGVWQGATNMYAKVGGVWQQVYQYDNTGPTVADWTVAGNDSNQMTFAWSGGPLVTDSESGVTNVQVQYQYTPWGGSGEGWNAWQNWSGSQWTASSGSYSFTVATAKRATQTAFPYAIQNRYYVDFRVIATDAAGNSTTKTMANGQLTRPYGTFYIVPQGSGATAADSYQVGVGFYGLTAHGVRSGDGTGVGGLNWSYGCWFYGDEVEAYHLIKNSSNQRYKADSGTLQAQRYQSSGISGTWAWQQHNLRYSNGATGASFLGNIVTASISGADASATLTLDSGHLSNFSDLSAKGFGMVRNGSSNYRVCRNWFEDFSSSGLITVVFN